MTESDEGYSPMHINFSPEERSLINGHAEVRGLPNGTLIRAVVAGALRSGELDTLLAAGFRAIPAKTRELSRKRRDYEREWPTIRRGLRAHGPWRLEMNRDYHSHGKGIEADHSKWWLLYHEDEPEVRRPVAFRAMDAVREATMIVEELEGTPLLPRSSTERPPAGAPGSEAGGTSTGEGLDGSHMRPPQAPPPSSAPWEQRIDECPDCHGRGYFLNAPGGGLRALTVCEHSQLRAS